MRKIFMLICLIIFLKNVYTQNYLTPLEEKEYNSVTTHTELFEYVKKVCDANEFITYEILCKSTEGRKIPVVYAAQPGSEKKVTVLFFAQQHGNEHSSKESSLLLLKKIANGYLDTLLQRITLILVPQLNPDGSEKNIRRNGNDKDLNRDHLLLSQPETEALHNLFYRFLPEVTLDVHEYYPYTESWKNFGYFKTFDVQFGTATNLNVAESMRNLSLSKFLPFTESYLNENGYTFHNYIVGGPPDVSRIRHSTVDINDGRQSFAILNTFSLILEGINGKESVSDNIKRRSEGQLEALISLLKFVYENHETILQTTAGERDRLFNPFKSDSVIIRMEHAAGDTPLKVSLYSIEGKKDTLVIIDNYHPVVNPLLSVAKPEGYFIPKIDTALINWLIKHHIRFYNYEESTPCIGSSYYIDKIDTVITEELPVYFPQLIVDEIEIKTEDFYYVPASQLQGNKIVIALEPHSMIGLVQYEEFNHLLKEKEFFPVLRKEHK